MKQYRVTLFSLLIGVSLTAPALAATEVRLGNRGLDQYHYEPRLDVQTNVTNFLSLGPDYDLKLLQQEQLGDGQLHSRYQLLYREIPVWAHQVVSLSTSQDLFQLRGFVLQDIHRDLREFTPKLSAAQALQSAQRDFASSHPLTNPQDEKSELVIYADDNARAHLAYAVSFFVHGSDVTSPSFPHYFIDARNGSVIFQYEGLNTGAYMGALGLGGNEKIGLHYYGGNNPGDFPLLYVYQPDQEEDLCLMQSPNTKTYDCGESTSCGGIHEFECYLNDYKEINEAYSPINDAHYFSNRTNSMYKKWLGGLTAWGKTIRARVHYKKGYENAFYFGGSVYFGDGNDMFYPLSTGADIVSHEIAHGFTERFSGLIYSGQSGGINESFSDIAGEAAEYYIYGGNDFLVGNHVGRSGPIRYMSTPSLDGKSIGHASKYYPGMDPHYSSGVFNKAFSKIASAMGVPQAFQIFARANRLYWHPSSDFVDAACSVASAAKDYKYDESVVLASFDSVGVDTTNACPESLCCKICYSGKACGNSCINANYNCNQPQGCACDPP